MRPIAATPTRASPRVVLAMFRVRMRGGPGAGPLLERSAAQHFARGVDQHRDHPAFSPETSQAPLGVMRGSESQRSVALFEHRRLPAIHPESAGFRVAPHASPLKLAT